VETPLTKDYLDRYELDSPVTQPLAVDCYDAGAELTAAAKAADEAGAADQAFVYRLLNTICHLHFRPEDRLAPYGPMATFANGSRTAEGSDFTRDQCEALFASRERLKCVALRARISDLTWLNNRQNVEAGRAAIADFVLLAERSLAGEGFAKHGSLEPGNHLVDELLQRAVTIGFALGWDRDENGSLKGVILSVYEDAKKQPGPNFSRAAELALRAGVLEPLAIFEDAMKLGGDALSRNQYDEAEWAFARASNAALHIKDEDRVRSAKTALSTAFEAKADAAPPGFMKTHALEQAIDALKGSRDSREARRNLHLKLADAQADVRDDFAKIEHKMDLSDLVTQTRESFQPLSLFEAIKQFALLAIPRDPETIIAEARKMAQQFPLSGLFPAVIVDDRGRTVAREGMSELGEPSRHAILRNESVYTSISVGGQIEVAREVIYSEKGLTEAALISLCGYSPFVPTHAANMLGEGLFAFFQRDYPKAGPARSRTARRAIHRHQGRRCRVELDAEFLA
jgi:hypothetical protein